MSRELRFRLWLREVIFGVEDKPGVPSRSFDVALMIFISLSLLAVMLDSMTSVSGRYGDILYLIEWGFTLMFTFEYLLRLYCVEQRWHYASSVYGVIDLVAVLPTYIAVLFPSAQALLALRAVRMLRMFRVLNLQGYLKEATQLAHSLSAARPKILVFLFSLVVLATIFGTILYLVEGGEHGFTSIPKRIYWAIITITTVGYGDIAPTTPIGQFIAALVTLTGYSIIAVPTGIITAEFSREMRRHIILPSEQSSVDGNERNCRNCERSGHAEDARHCRFCGARLQLEPGPDSSVN